MTNPNTIADPTLGVCAQARAILAMLDRNPDFAEYENGRYQIDIETRAWYNGREKGVSLTVSRLGYKGCLVITFGEHRSSDSIFVDCWEMKAQPFNSPTVSDFPDEAYKQRKFFTSGRVGDAAEYIYERMESFYKTLTRHEDKTTPHWAKTIQGDADAQGG